MTGALHAALDYARRGWPALPTEPGGKAPLTPHGVLEATTDPRTLERYWRRWPDAGVAIATGAPGPQVLDVDDLAAFRQAGDALPLASAPVVATPRGRHYYFAGTDRGTVRLDYGELRGTGSYVIAPPSVHPTGKAYVWWLEPTGPLPPVPSTLVAARTSAGCGDHRPPAELVAYGQRWPYLRDIAVRLARGGFDEAFVLAHLRLELERACEPWPPPERGSLEALAAWAVDSRIARRERAVAAGVEHLTRVLERNA